MSSSLEERLKSNSSAFDGLLSLIPAKYYYDDDTQDQWKAKKKSKEESKQNKRAKLDPTAEQYDQGASASQVLKKRAKDAKPVVLPGQKRLPTPEPEEEEDEDEDEDEEEEDDNDEEETEQYTPEKNNKQNKTNGRIVKEQKINGNTKKASKDTSKNDDDEEEESINFIFDDEGNEVDLEEPKPKREAPKKKELTEEEKAKKKEATRLLREKLANKISVLKEKRKAPGSKVVGAPSSREAILDERRRKAALKEERKRKRDELEKDDSDDEDAEEEEDDSDIENDESVMYQTIQFDDNTRATSDLQNLRTKKQKKGPAKKDFKGHLKLIEAKKQKLSQLEGSKQQELADKEKWNRTIAQAEGQKLRDDEKLLKKALKRKEVQKRKSEIQWQERKDHVQNMISAKQQRREENLQIRKDNKGMKRKNQQKQKRKFKTGVSQKRAGFEGRLKSGKKK